jgi:hypothetical protein
MSFIRTLGEDKSQIIKDLAFCFFLNNQLPSAERSFLALFKEFDERLLQEDKKLQEEH